MWIKLKPFVSGYENTDRTKTGFVDFILRRPAHSGQDGGEVRLPCGF
jgi:hypothetical protein